MTKEKDEGVSLDVRKIKYATEGIRTRGYELDAAGGQKFLFIYV